jgi:hypothetical protein
MWVISEEVRSVRGQVRLLHDAARVVLCGFSYMLQFSPMPLLTSEVLPEKALPRPLLRSASTVRRLVELDPDEIGDEDNPKGREGHADEEDEKANGQ